MPNPNELPGISNPSRDSLVYRQPNEPKIVERKRPAFWYNTASNATFFWNPNSQQWIPIKSINSAPTTTTTTTTTLSPTAVYPDTLRVTAGIPTSISLDSSGKSLISENIVLTFTNSGLPLSPIKAVGTLTVTSSNNNFLIKNSSGGTFSKSISTNSTYTIDANSLRLEWIGTDPSIFANNANIIVYLTFTLTLDNAAQISNSDPDWSPVTVLRPGSVASQIVASMTNPATIANSSTQHDQLSLEAYETFVNTNNIYISFLDENGVLANNFNMSASNAVTGIIIQVIDNGQNDFVETFSFGSRDVTNGVSSIPSFKLTLGYILRSYLLDSKNFYKT